MFKIEEKILQKIDKYLPFIIIAGVTALSLIIRLGLFDYKSRDFNIYLNPWYEQIAQNGVKEQIGNYNFIYQFIIFIMTKLPIKALWAYKSFSLVFDYLLGFAAYKIIKLFDKESSTAAIIVYCGVIMSPIVIINSSFWAQCDSVYMFFCLLAMYFLMREKYSVSMIFLGLALAFKLQTVIFLPLFLAVYFIKRKFSIIQFLIVPLTMVAVNIPMLILGRSISEMFYIYKEQTTTYKAMFMNYPSFWALIDSNNSEKTYFALKNLAICVALLICGFMIYYWNSIKIDISYENITYMALLISFTCVLFLPAMHERYGYIYEILAILVAAINPKTILLAGGLIGVTCVTYGEYLFNSNSLPLSVAAVINIALYGAYMYILNKKMCTAKRDSNS